MEINLNRRMLGNESTKLLFQSRLLEKINSRNSIEEGDKV